MRGQAVIAGIGHTAFGKHPGRSTLSLNVEAIRLALEDARIEKGRVDGLFVKFPTSRFEMMYGQQVAESLGIVPRIGGVWDQGGAANASMIGFAAMAIEARQCEIAVVCFADNPRTGSRNAYQKAWGDDGIFGWFGIPAGYAMIARRHMQEHGTTELQLGEVAVACRRHGAVNPNAQLRSPLTMADYLDAPWLIEPMRRTDCCLVSDGGAAVVVTSARLARQLGVPRPVPILGFGQGQTSEAVHLRRDMTSTAAVVSARTAYAMAGLGPRDIDVAQIYDCFTITVLITLEDYGFCAKGEGGVFASGGNIAVGGELPVNTSGGLLSETGMPGLQLVVEGVRQMRGTSHSQVPGAETCIVSNQGGVMHTHSTLILGQSLN